MVSYLVKTAGNDQFGFAIYHINKVCLVMWIMTLGGQARAFVGSFSVAVFLQSAGAGLIPPHVRKTNQKLVYIKRPTPKRVSYRGPLSGMEYYNPIM